MDQSAEQFSLLMTPGALLFICFGTEQVFSGPALVLGVFGQVEEGSGKLPAGEGDLWDT